MRLCKRARVRRSREDTGAGTSAQESADAGTSPSLAIPPPALAIPPPAPTPAGRGAVQRLRNLPEKEVACSYHG